MFQIQGDAYFRKDLKRLAHKILMLKSNFELVGRKFVRCFIALQNSKPESKPFKTSCQFVLLNKNKFFVEKF